MASTDERRNVLIGGAVMLALCAAIAIVHISSAHSKAAGYELVARFHKAEGITVGSEVRLAGVVVGRVNSQTLDERFRAVLGLRLTPNVHLPKDSNAAVQTDGLLGAKFIALQGGGDEEILKPGDEIAYTQDSLAVEDLLALIIAQAENARATPKEGTAKQP